MGRVSAIAGLGAAGSRLSDHSGGDVLSGRGPGCDGFVGHVAAGAAVRAGPRTEPDDLDEFVWQFGHHAAVRPRPEYRRGRAASAGCDQRRLHVPAGGSAESSDLQQGESGRFADPHAGDDFGLAAAVEGGGSGRHRAGAENFAVAGRGTGFDQRRTEAGGAHSGESDGAGFLRIEPGRCAHRAGRRPMWIRRKA